MTRKRNKYVTKLKTPLTDVGERQQKRRISDFVSSAAERAEQEGVTPSKLHAFGLKNRYSEKGKVGEVGKQLFSNNNNE